VITRNASCAFSGIKLLLSKLYNRSGVLPPGVKQVDIRSAIVRRPGKHVTLVSYGGTLFKTWYAHIPGRRVVTPGTRDMFKDQHRVRIGKRRGEHEPRVLQCLRRRLPRAASCKPRRAQSRHRAAAERGGRLPRFDPLLRQRLRRVEGWRSGSLSAEISARIMEGAFWELDAPVGRVCSSEVPIPYPHHLEEAALPQPAAIVAAAKATLGG
jgi:2-oxoisovalerate dehydrogenase E1 component